MIYHAFLSATQHGAAKLKTPLQKIAMSLKRRKNFK